MSNVSNSQKHVYAPKNVPEKPKSKKANMIYDEKTSNAIMVGECLISYKDSELRIFDVDSEDDEVRDFVHPIINISGVKIGKFIKIAVCFLKYDACLVTLNESLKIIHEQTCDAVATHAMISPNGMYCACFNIHKSTVTVMNLNNYQLRRTVPFDSPMDRDAIRYFYLDNQYAYVSFEAYGHIQSLNLRVSMLGCNNSRGEFICDFHTKFKYGFPDKPIINFSEVMMTYVEDTTVYQRNLDTGVIQVWKTNLENIELVTASGSKIFIVKGESVYGIDENGSFGKILSHSSKISKMTYSIGKHNYLCIIDEEQLTSVYLLK